MQRTACVYFDSPRGKLGHVTAGRSLFEAASNALDWFSDPHWHGPRPAPSTCSKSRSWAMNAAGSSPPAA
jgi:hypothetical protein